MCRIFSDQRQEDVTQLLRGKGLWQSLSALQGCIHGHGCLGVSAGTGCDINSSFFFVLQMQADAAAAGSPADSLGLHVISLDCAAAVEHVPGSKERERRRESRKGHDSDSGQRRDSSRGDEKDRDREKSREDRDREKSRDDGDRQKSRERSKKDDGKVGGKDKDKEGDDKGGKQKEKDEKEKKQGGGKAEDGKGDVKEEGAKEEKGVEEKKPADVQKEQQEEGKEGGKLSRSTSVVDAAFEPMLLEPVEGPIVNGVRWNAKVSGYEQRSDRGGRMG